MLDESNRKPNKILIDGGSEFYNRSMKHFYKISIKKCVRHLMEKNLLLLKDSLEP